MLIPSTMGLTNLKHWEPMIKTKWKLNYQDRSTGKEKV